MNGIEFDEVLNLEHKFYQEGYEEGRNENLRKNLLEGKQYGLQVGFQRFQLLGTIYGVCTILEEKIDDNALQKNIKTIKSLIEDIKLDNKPVSYTHLDVYKRQVQQSHREILETNKKLQDYCQRCSQQLEYLNGLL